MLSTLKSIFAQTTEQSSVDDDIKLAAATLMFEVIRSDGSIDDIEYANMQSLLIEQFDLPDVASRELVEHAQESSNTAISLQGFTREICEHWNNAQRVQLVQHLWLLAFADNNIDRHERHIIRKIAGLLYLNDAEIITAKERAKRQHLQT